MDASESKPNRSYRLFIVIAVVLSLAAGVWLGNQVLNRKLPLEQISATVLNPPKAISDFRLTNHRDEPFTLDSLKGKWSFLFFGYTHCPDICPTTLHTLAQMDRILADDPDTHANVQVVFVSVDPRRDTVQQLGKYVPYFNKAFVGVTGTEDEINRMTKQLGILHIRVEQKQGQDYLVDHSASVLLFSPNGALRALFGAPHEAQRLAADFKKIRKWE
jgi:protein SCO1/2